ncbi:hypothetical protein GCM10027280_35540 [Micromonospora polyrhachis]|uniref:Ricin B lectin domain-containing protein n=1 Tax=Micromonospora polyrhachis TaxID=1282883 RepID=A0A7W7SQ14_9ACTN|nr:ricin-type beta-trefoil lectin domain protein [Micromonospora polyrhachis]MBB4958843.1 hypothetical protein [Micromonospora polyrhachis]
MSRPKKPALRARWRTVLAAIILVVVAGAGTAVVMATLGNKEQTPLPGVAVPPGYLRPITEAAGSCPTLTPAKLAGQLMAESRFVADATTARAGRGLAGLTDDEWRTWQPWSGVDQGDAEASVFALAHYLCHLIGQVREVKLEGEVWPLAVAAYHSGMPAVISANGVPDGARDYVVRTGRYAAWYALNTGFNESALLAAGPETTATASPRSTPSPKASSSPSNVVSASPSSSRQATPRGSSTGGSLVNDEYHSCLTANPPRDGTRLMLAKCDGSPAQSWEPRPDGTIRASGLCMDAANAGQVDFTPVQVAVCQGNPAQQFLLIDKRIYSMHADKCVNIHYNPGEGTTIVLFSCLSQSNQFFRLQKR